jgi:RNA polymerase sigma-70 factor (ECF subfamily)
MSEVHSPPFSPGADPNDLATLSRWLWSYEAKLCRMVQLRLHPRLRGRIEAADVVQDTYVEAIKRLKEYGRAPDAPLFLWLRGIASEKLIDAHRRHLGAEKRDARREVPLLPGAVLPADSTLLAAQMLGRLTTPSRAAMRAEMRRRVQDVLDSLEVWDREILALRHFEQLDNAETAQVLGLTPSGASSRYVRALKRFKAALGSPPDPGSA